MRTIAFTKTAFVEYNEWFEVNKQIISRIKELIRGIENVIHLKALVSLNHYEVNGQAIGAGE